MGEVKKNMIEFEDRRTEKDIFNSILDNLELIKIEFNKFVKETRDIQDLENETTKEMIKGFKKLEKHVFKNSAEIEKLKKKLIV